MGSWFCRRGTCSELKVLAEFCILSRPFDRFAFHSPILSLVFHAPAPGPCPFVIVCKGCHENIPAPVETMPGSWIIAACPLCGEQRRYLPIDIFLGRLSHDLLARSRRRGGEKWAK